MKNMTVGIIGTAGRGEDKDKLTNEVWRKLNIRLIEFVKSNDFTKVVSGGAAYIDHCAVMYYKAGIIPDISLKMPCKWLPDYHTGFDPSHIDGQRSLRYHYAFINKTKIPSLAQLNDLYDKMEFYDGFFNRNKKVAEEADVLIAATFGDKEYLKDGGTSHTMKHFIKQKGNSLAFHLDLNTMNLYPDAKVA